MQTDWFTFLPDWMNNGYFLWALASVVQFWVGWQFYTTAWSALKHGSHDDEHARRDGLVGRLLLQRPRRALPRASSSTRASASRCTSTPSAFIITLILLGRLLEARAKGQTGAAIKALIGLQPKTARVVRDGAEADVPVEQVLAGDLVVVRPGEKIPVDGVVVEGARRWTSRCSPASRSRWTSSRATRSSAPR